MRPALRARLRRLALRVCAALLCAATPALPRATAAAPGERFFIRGSGTIRIRATNGRRFAGRYRAADGRYVAAALRRINRVFGASGKTPATRISVRLIERLAHLRDKLGGRWLVISSGYRSPRYNQTLRDKGRTVAQASLHQYGMACDLRLEGVDSEAVWRFAKEHKLGGAGYYGSPWLHLDTGPARYWTQGTANVHKGLSLHNKRIILVPEHDIYAAGETVALRFARMTAYPIGVKPRFTLQRKGAGDAWSRVSDAPARFARGAGRLRDGCRTFSSVESMAGVSWTLPAALAPGRYRLQVSFCDVRWEAMPAQITSYELDVRR